MQTESEYDMLTVVNGWIVCPVCRKKLHGVKVLPDSHAQGIGVSCSACKLEMIVNIAASGQCVYRPCP